MAKAIDIGTAFLVSAAQDNNAQIQTKTIRDAFIDMENDDSVKGMLKMSGVDFIETDDKLYVLGNSAVTMANLFKRECRRPLSRGVISPGELEAEKILMILIENILGKAKAPGETCFYSVPAAPINGEFDIIYHAAMFSKMISQLGYAPKALNEAAAILFSNAAPENFSGISISAGAGMLNVCLMYQTVIGMSFSIIGSGDWIDEAVAKATGNTASRIQSIKEKGVNLLDPNEGDPKTFREREALIVYYKSLILRVLNAIKEEFLKRQSTSLEMPNAIPIILSGGTSLAKGFTELFESGFNTMKGKFPIQISSIRAAKNPLEAVAQGLLVAALNSDESGKK